MKSVLRLPPKTRVNDALNEEDFLVEQKAMIAKTKWGRRRIFEYNEESKEENGRKFEELNDEEKLKHEMLF